MPQLQALFQLLLMLCPELIKGSLGLIQLGQEPEREEGVAGVRETVPPRVHRGLPDKLSSDSPASCADSYGSQGSEGHEGDARQTRPQAQTSLLHPCLCHTDAAGQGPVCVCTPGVFLSCFSCCYLRQGLSWNPELANFARMAGLRAPGICLYLHIL